MKNSGKLVSFLVPIISILLAFVIGCIIMAVLGANPFVALESLWIGAFGSLRNVGTTLARSTPLIFTSLCACFAYRCGVFNLGGEGQFLMGSIVCCYIATQSGIEGLPAILLCLVGGAVAGGLWSLISGLLKVYRGQNEMIITIMLNYVATLFMGVVYTDWLRDGSVPQTQAVPEATQLSRLFGLRVTSAFVIALAVGLLVYYFLFYTSKGFQLRAVGLNMTAAEFNGFAVKKYILMSFIVSGAIAGLGGSAELLGTQFRLINGFGNGYGFDAIFRASLYLGLLPLVYAPATPLVLILPLAILLFKRTFREAVVAAAGLILPLLTACYVSWGMGDEFTAPVMTLADALVSGVPLWIFKGLPLPSLVMLCVIAALALTALLFFLSDIYAAGTKPRFILIFNTGILAMTLALLCTPSVTPEAFTLTAVPAALLFPVFFVRIDRRIALPVYLILLAASVYIATLQ